MTYILEYKNREKMYCIGLFLSAKEILKSKFVRGNINVSLLVRNHYDAHCVRRSEPIQMIIVSKNRM
jgi:hypothetical protein